MLDLMVRNANLPDGRRGCDIAVHAGRIRELSAGDRRPGPQGNRRRRVPGDDRRSSTAISTWTPP